VTHDYLQPMGFDMNNNSDDGYQVALDLLQSHYGRDNNFM